MASLQATLRSHYATSSGDLRQVLRSVNGLFYDWTESHRFATLFLGEYDDETRRLTYANCGHLPPVLLRASGKVERLASTATVIGILPDWDAALSGVLGIRNDDGALRFDLIVISAYMILAFFGGLTTHLQRVDNLPLSRRKLLAMLMTPPVLALVAGYGIGLAVIAAQGPRDLIQLHPAECCGTFVTLASARCGIAWDGHAPAYEAPWGESHVAWSTPLYRGSRVRVYSPFSSADPPSAKYMAWQISRATEAVYDRQVPQEEILSRYLGTDPSGKVTPVAAGMPLLRDFPGLRARFAGPAFPVLMLLVCVPGFLLSALYLRSFRAHRGQRARTRILWGVLLVLLIVHMSQYALLATGVMKTWVFEGIFEIAIRKLGDAFPGSSLLVWIASGLLVYLAYRAAERSFERIEVAGSTEA